MNYSICPRAIVAAILVGIPSPDALSYQGQSVHGAEHSAAIYFLDVTIRHNKVTVKIASVIRQFNVQNRRVHM